MVDWLKLNPQRVEWTVGNLYERLGFKSIITSLSKDGGVDVYANYFDQTTENYLKYVIQVKRWKNSMGVKGVRELLGVKEDQKADRAILVSVSGYTKPAKEFASRHEIQLINKAKFEELLAKVNLLKIDGSLTSASDPNLPLNRKKFIHQLLVESRPKGLSRENIIKNIFTPDFGVTVKKEVLERDVDELSKRGEVIEENGLYFSKISDEEVLIVSQSLISDVEKMTHVFTEKDVYELLERKYKVPLPTAQRLIPVAETLHTLASLRKITHVVDGVYMPPGSIGKLRKFDWTRDSMQKSILELMHLSANVLKKNMEEVRIKMGIPEGPILPFFREQPFVETPFIVILLHFCKGRKRGLIEGISFLPLFVHPFNLLTKEEKEHLHLKVLKKKKKLDSHLVVTAPGITTEALQIVKEKARKVYQYGAKFVDLIKAAKLEENFELGSKGNEVGFFAPILFDRIEKLEDVLDKLLDKAEILRKFLIEVYEKCPPPVELSPVHIETSPVHIETEDVDELNVDKD